MNSLLKELAQRAEALTEEERGSLAATLLRGLSVPDHDVTDEEVMERMAEAERSPEVLLSEDEFKRGIRRRGSSLSSSGSE